MATIARWRHLVNDAVQSNDDDTFSFKLPENGALHALLIRVRATNGATSGRNVSPLSIADEVRVIGNGDERYFMLQPVEIEKWYEVMNGMGLDMLQNEAAAGQQYVLLPVMFGRQMFDPEYFLPLDRIKEARIEIPFSPTIAADAGFATGTTAFNIMALWSPGSARLPYRGTLVTRTIKSFTSAASGDDETDIDISDPIRAIGIYAYENQVNDGVDVTAVRLEANSGEFDLWKGDWNDLQQVTRQGWGASIRHAFQLLAQDTDVIDTRISVPKWWALQALDGIDVTADTFTTYAVTSVTGDRLALEIGLADVTAGAETHVTDTTDRRYQLVVEGESPSYFGMIDYADIDDVSGYLMPDDYDKLKVVLTQGGAGGSVRIALQYLKQILAPGS